MSEIRAGEGTAAGRLVRTTLRVLPWLLMAMLAGALLVLGVRAVVPVRLMEPAAAAAGDLLQALASIEAVLLAFVVFVVWQQFDEARAAVDKEANELRDLERSASALPEPVGSAVRAAARRYAVAVISREWPAMRTGDEATLAQTWGVLDEIWTALHACELAGPSEQHLHAEALARFNDLSDARTNRLTASRRRMPETLTALLYCGATALVVTCAFLPVSNGLVHAGMAAMLAGALSHVLLVVIDLDDSFAGDWSVSAAPFERVLARMDASSRHAQGGENSSCVRAEISA